MSFPLRLLRRYGPIGMSIGLFGSLLIGVAQTALVNFLLGEQLVIAKYIPLDSGYVPRLSLEATSKIFNATGRHLEPTGEPLFIICGARAFETAEIRATPTQIGGDNSCARIFARNAIGIDQSVTFHYEADGSLKVLSVKVRAIEASRHISGLQNVILLMSWLPLFVYMLAVCFAFMLGLESEAGERNVILDAASGVIVASIGYLVFGAHAWEWTHLIKQLALNALLVVIIYCFSAPAWLFYYEKLRTAGRHNGMLLRLVLLPIWITIFAAATAGVFVVVAGAIRLVILQVMAIAGPGWMTDI